MSEEKKCKHDLQLIPIEDFGFDYNEDTEEYVGVPDEDIPIPCHITMQCVECYQHVSLRVTGKIVHKRED